jgi:hypothetical protein
MKKSPLKVSAKKINDTQISVTLTNDSGNPVAFFNRIALLNAQTNQRILPSFFTNNYISILPGESKTITIEYRDKDTAVRKKIQVYGWNVEEQIVDIKE